METFLLTQPRRFFWWKAGSSDGLYYSSLVCTVYGRASKLRKATIRQHSKQIFIHLVHMARKKMAPKTPSAEPLFAPGGSEDRARGNSSGYLSDIFSEFTKHITPAFNHERPDR